MSLTAINWDQLKQRYSELNEQLVSPSLESAKRIALQKELAYLSSLLSAYNDVAELERKCGELERQRAEIADPELAVLYDEELSELSEAYDRASTELEKRLFPPDERDNLSVFLEIRAGAGGAEAALFAGDLARMYMMYALKKGWKASVVSESPTDLGGFREVILHIDGKGVFGQLKHESGVHRVQRVPKTEASGRIHTSTATVAVMPEGEDAADIEINPSDLRVDTFRAGGAGGQHVNKTDSAIRITHIPSGVVVACQEDRSQHKNRATAMKMLKSRLVAAEREKREAEERKARKEAVGGATRAEKARTYNYPQNRVSDHQINLTLNKLDMVMEGNLDEIVEGLMEHDRKERKSTVAYPFKIT